MIERHYLDDAVVQLRKLKTMADKALAQVTEEQLFATLDPEANSLALIMKHLAGNMRSRWTDFLTSDGEKPNRHRDSEFVVEGPDSAAHMFALWEVGWTLVLDTVGALSPDDLQKTVRVRGESHTVLEAINRQMSHYAQHVGQIVLLAKHFAGSDWKTLSIPRGQSAKFDVSKSGEPYKA